ARRHSAAPASRSPSPIRSFPKTSPSLGSLTHDSCQPQYRRPPQPMEENENPVVFVDLGASEPTLRPGSRSPQKDSHGAARKAAFAASDGLSLAGHHGHLDHPPHDRDRAVDGHTAARLVADRGGKRAGGICDLL